MRHIVTFLRTLKSNDVLEMNKIIVDTFKENFTLLIGIQQRGARDGCNAGCLHRFRSFHTLTGISEWKYHTTVPALRVAS